MSIEYSGQVNATSGIFTTNNGALLAAYPSRRTVLIQNLGTATLYVKLGPNATTTDFNFILKAGTNTDDGNGGVFSEDNLSYTGVISVAGSSSVRCIGTDL